MKTRSVTCRRATDPETRPGKMCQAVGDRVFVKEKRQIGMKSSDCRHALKVSPKGLQPATTFQLGTRIKYQFDVRKQLRKKVAITFIQYNQEVNAPLAAPMTVILHEPPGKQEITKELGRIDQGNPPGLEWQFDGD